MSAVAELPSEPRTGPGLTLAEPVGGKAFPIKSVDDGPMSYYFDRAKFEQAYSIAQLFARSDMVPGHFKGKVENCFIACQLAARMRADPFMVMQHTYIVHGRPGFDAKFVIALVNTSGLFTGPMEFAFSGERGKPNRAVNVSATLKDGRLCSSLFTLATAIEEGWVKNNQKWRTMEDQMMCYRGAAFFSRTQCPEVMMGIHTVEELEDISPSFVESRAVGSSNGADKTAANITEKLAKPKAKVVAVDPPAEAPPSEVPSEPAPPAEPAPPEPDARDQLVNILAAKCECSAESARERLDRACKVWGMPFSRISDTRLALLAGKVRDGTVTVTVGD